MRLIGAVSAAAVAFVATNEGTITNAYKDQGGVVTACTGHTDKTLRLGMQFTPKQCDAFLTADLRTAAIAVDTTVIVPLNANQRTALVDFTFNLGTTAMEHSTLVRKLNTGCYQCAANEFPKWDIVAGKHNPGVRKRRLREQALFNLKV